MAISASSVGKFGGGAIGGYVGYGAGAVIKYLQESSVLSAWAGALKEYAYTDYAVTGSNIVEYIANGFAWAADKASFLPPEMLMITSVVLGIGVGAYYGARLVNSLASLGRRQASLA